MNNTDILSIQLYSLRSLGELDRVLDTASQAGYRYVETVGSHLDDADNVRAKLEARDLKASSSHVGLAALRERPEAVLTACHYLGFDQLFMPAVPLEQRKGDAAFWRALGHELGQIAERFHDQGISFGYHNHDWELAPKEGAKTALELIFEEAAGSPLAWQVDIALLVRGGAGPKEWMQRYRDRVVSAHVTSKPSPIFARTTEAHSSSSFASSCCCAANSSFSAEAALRHSALMLRIARESRDSPRSSGDQNSLSPAVIQ